MMKLRYAKASPFVRKVLVLAEETGLIESIACTPTDVWAADTDIAQDNPIGKIPALITPDGTFVGSFACCDYLDHQHSGRAMIPREGRERWRVMQIHGLADGAMEAAIAYIIETLRRPAEFTYQTYLDRQIGKISQAIAALEARAQDFTEVDLGSITTACMLGYLDFRLKDKLDWRKNAPMLTGFYADFSGRASMQKTKPDA